MLNEEQINKVKTTLATSGWNDVMSPAMLNRGKAALKALILSTSEREKAGGEFADADDHTLRAIIRDAEWMASAWRNEITVFDENRRVEELHRQHNGEA